MSYLTSRELFYSIPRSLSRMQTELIMCHSSKPLKIKPVQDAAAAAAAANKLASSFKGTDDSTNNYRTHPNFSSESPYST